MKGNNKLLLNHAEMIRALEYYLNEVQFKEGVKVESISENKGNNEFEVKISEEDCAILGEVISP